jgi:hypothetical protein
MDIEQKKNTGQSLFEKIRNIETFDTRDRKMDHTTTKWVLKLEENKTDFSPVQIFNWLAGVKVYSGNDQHSVVLVTPPIGTGYKYDSHVYSTWLPRIFPDLMQAERATKITINGLEGWQYPKGGKND